MRLLFIGAHPADLIDLAAGTIANHVKAGDEVYTLAVTCGMYSHPLSEGMKLPANADIDFLGIKNAECIEGLGFLGVSNKNMVFEVFLDGPYIDIDFDYDGEHYIPSSLANFIARNICDLKPDVLITHHPMESHHPDHAKVAQWTIEAARAAGGFFADLKPHKVSNIFFYGYQFHPNMVKLGHPVLPPDVVVDITEVVKDKAEAFMAMPSQYNTEKVVWSRLNSFEKEWGRQYGFEYAETFISYQPCRTTLLPDFGKADFQSLLRKQAGG